MTPNVALRRLRRVLIADPAERVSDAEWLRRFADGRDEEAFAVLVKRHGPMVLNVCRGVLRHGHDAEDVFQAAFLVLAQKAGTIRRGEALGSWLYGVAYRLAVKARARAERRRVRERRVEDVPDPDPMLDMTLREFRALLHEELGRLPEKYRGPLVLCYLEDRTQEEAARQLGCPRGVLRGRLDRGREQLRRRLTRRGVTLSAGLLTVALGQMGAASAVPVGLARATAAAACGPAGQGFPALAGEGGKVMGWTKGKVVGVLFLIGVLGLGAGVLARHRVGTEPPAEKKAEAPALAKETPPLRDLYGDRLPDGAVVRLGSVHLRHGGKVTSVVFTPDGNTVISGGQDNTVRFWDPRTGREVNRLVPVEGPGADNAWVESVAVSPDGKYVAAGTGNGPAAAFIWERATGKLLHRLDGEQRKVSSVAFSRDGKLLASGGADGNILLWDVATGRKVATCKGHGGWVEAVAFAPVGELLASASRDKTVRLWDLEGKELHTLKGPKDMAISVAFSPDGKTVAGGCWRGGIHLWEVASGKEVGFLPAERQNVSGLVFLPDGVTLVSSSWSWGVRFWDLKTGKERRHLTGHRGPIPGLALSPDGKTLATGSWDRTVRLWDVASGKEVLPAKGHTHAVWSVTYSPDGKTVATGSEDGTVRLWDAATGKELRRLEGHSGLVDLLAYSADGKTLATSSWDHHVRTWEAATGKRLKEQQLEGIGFTYSPDRKWLAGGDGEGAVWLADAGTGKRVHEFKGQTGWVTLAFSPDGKLLASGGEKTDGTVVLWDVATGKEVRRLKGVPHRYYALAFSPDGRYLAGTSANAKVYTRQGPIVLWEVATGREVRRFEGHTGTVGSLAFSPDGRTLASGAGDQTVRLWEVATGKQRRSFAGHEGVIRSVAFSPDGRRLASASQDTTGLVWDVTGLGPEGKAPGLTVRKRDALWKALRDADAPEAYRAVWRLAASPSQALPLLREHLKPLRPADPKRVEKLIGDLASESFAVRRKATAELEKLGDLAEGSLRTHLRKTRELEERRRVEALLARLDVPSGERLRSLRAVEVLEHIDTAGARALLRELSRGAPSALLTREAQAALGRLGE